MVDIYLSCTPSLLLLSLLPLPSPGYTQFCVMKAISHPHAMPLLLYLNQQQQDHPDPCAFSSFFYKLGNSR